MVRRDVFYYRNLSLGGRVVAQLLACDRVGETRVKTRMRLHRWDDRAGAAGEAMADLVTERELTERCP